MRHTISLIFLEYLRLIAKLQLTKIKFLQQLKGEKLTIIGITGSAGKSTTMQALEAILAPLFTTKTNYGANSESGIPLNILGITITDFKITNWILIAILAPIKLLTNWTTYSIYIIEMGIDSPDAPKNMSYLLKILQPHISIFLNVGTVHSQAFDKLVDRSITGGQRNEAILQQIASEKSKIVNSLNASDYAIINSNDKYVVQSTQNTLATRLTLGTDSSNTLQLISSTNDSHGFTSKFKYQNKNYSLTIKNQIFPEIYQVSFASAILAATTLNIPLQTIITNLESGFHSPVSRSNILKGIHNSTIIDSSYNSSPTPTAEMLKLLSSFPKPRIAILGDMRELGNQSQIEHQKIFQIAQKSADLIIGIGPETSKYFSHNPHNFTFWWQAEDFLKDFLSQNPNSTILVKGSQNTIYLEELIKTILDTSAPANQQTSELLCRQSPYWLHTKTKFRQENS